VPRILIIGDSFAANWNVKHSTKGWPNLLSETYEITNLAQAGVSEYRVYQQLISVKNLDTYDLVIVSHTSPYRIYTPKHPVHAGDPLHNNADLMLNDLCHHARKPWNMFNTALHSAIKFFIYHTDDDYLETVYRLLREKINFHLRDINVIEVNGHAHLKSFSSNHVVVDFSERVNPGETNHLSQEDNLHLCQLLVKQIQQMLSVKS